MYAAQNGYIFIGESLVLVLSKPTFLLARFDVKIFLSCNIVWPLYDLFCWYLTVYEKLSYDSLETFTVSWFQLNTGLSIFES